MLTYTYIPNQVEDNVINLDVDQVLQRSLDLCLQHMLNY